LIDVAEDGVLRYRNLQQPDSEVAPPQQLFIRPDEIDVLAVHNRAVAMLQSTGALWVQVDETSRFVTELPYFLYNITLTSDARVIAAMSDIGGYSPLCIWVESSYRCSELEDAWFAALNGDGSLIALGNADSVIVRQLAVDGAATTQFEFDLPGGFIGLTALAMSADGRRLAAVTSDELYVWHLDDANPALTVRRLRGNFANRVGLYLTGNTQTITYRTTDGSLAVWTLEAHTLERIICHTVTANLAFTEWQQYFPDEPYRRICPNLPDGVGVSAN
jgi:hypothetical protein